MSKPPRDHTSFGSNTYFVTASTWSHRSLFQTERMACLFIDTLHHYRREQRFVIHEFVVMRDHFHLLLTPTGISLEKAMQFIKGGFSFRLKSKLDVWMRSFNESQISTEEKFKSCLRYIEENPVRRGLVSTPQAHPFSSAALEPLDPMPVHLQRNKTRA